MKFYNSLNFQFVLIFSIFILALVATTSILSLRQLAEAVEMVFAENGIHIVKRAVSFIDGDAFEALTISLDEEDPFYEETRVKLLDLKNSSGCMYLYTMAPLEGDTWLFIIDGSTEPEDEEGFSPIGEEEDISEYDDSFLRVFASGQIEAAKLTEQGDWGWLVSIYAPIINSAGRVVGVVGVDFDGESLRTTILEAQKKQILFGGISITLGLIMIMLFLRLIFRRLHNINVILKEISHGEGDLTKRIKVDKDDEIGELSKYFNLTLDKIKNLIIAIKEEADNLHNVGNELASNMVKTAGSVNQITENVQTIKEKVNHQTTSVSQTYHTMQMVTQNINVLGSNVKAQTSTVAESSHAIEEMLANVQTVTQALIQNAENVEELMIVSDESRSSLQKVTEDIQEIASESEGLLEINAVIENIARQTNLLSMNAAIEAAHAGDAGKGFAVVAGEIRLLAINSSDQSKIISDVLTKIKHAIDTIITSTDTVLKKFEIIQQRVHTVSEQETSIRNSMEKQGQGSQRIIDALSNLNKQTQLVKTASDEMLVGSKEVISESRNLEKATNEISVGMNDVAEGTNDINTAVKHVSDISIKTREHIEILFDEISKFKVK